MRNIESEGYNTFKFCDTRHPILAAMVVNGICYDESDKGVLFGVTDNRFWIDVSAFLLEYRQRIEPVFEASLVAIKNGKLKEFEKVWIDFPTESEKKYLADFYIGHDVVDGGYVKLLKPIDYVKWVIEKTKFKVPVELMVITDENGKDIWGIPVKGIPYPPTNRMTKEKRQKIYEEYKKYPFWTRHEAISLLFGYNPKENNFGKDFLDHEERTIALKALNMSILSESIEIIDNNKDQLVPFSFLLWAEDKYPIPNELKSLLQNKVIEFEIEDKKNKTKEIIKDKKSRCFISRNDGTWKIIFNGESDSFKIGKPIEYIAEVLKQPHGETINYIKLGQLVAGTFIDNKSTGSYDFNIESSGKKHTDEEKQTMKYALEKQYKEYLIDPNKENDDWLKIKKYAEIEFGIITKDDAGKLSFAMSKWQNENNPDFEKARKTVSRNKTLFLSKIEKFTVLHEHFKTYLNAENGIVYTPPEKSPIWEIIYK